MTQLTFQNIRNLGANSNQPLITNQNDFQIFDNVTLDQGQAHAQGGGSLTLRSREILNADTIIGIFNFNNNMTSNCAGQPAGCTINSATGFDVASFMLGLVNTKARNLFDAGTYTEKRPEISTLRAGRLPRQPEADAESRRALGRVSALDRGRRPAVELRRDDRAVRRRLRRRDDRRRQSRTPPADLLEGRHRPAASVSPTTSPATARRWSAAASASSGTSRPAARRRRRPRIRRSCSRRRSTPTPTAYGVNLLLKDGLPLPPGVDPSAPRRGNDPLDLRHQLPRRLRAAVEPQRPARTRQRTTWSRSRTSVRRAGRWCSRATPTRRRRSSA